MNIVCMSSRRKGLSTILGTLVFVGILFSSIIPMMLVMNQADTMYEQRKFEQQKEDERRDLEELKMTVFPLTKWDNSLNFTVNSVCAVPVNITRVWINNEFYTINTMIPAMNTEKLPAQTIDLVNGQSYYVKIVSDNNVITPSDTGVLYYNSSDGWQCESLKIVIICSSWGSTVDVSITQDPSYSFSQTYSKSTTGSIQIDHEVPASGTYNVKVKVKLLWWWKTVYDGPVTITWPGGSSIEWIYC